MASSVHGLIKSVLGYRKQITKLKMNPFKTRITELVAWKFNEEVQTEV